MAEQRRPRAATVEKRLRLLDVTEQIMLEEGYAAVSSRSVAARAGINAPLVHYYFPSLDDLFVAVFRRRAERNVERMATALASPTPLRAWWELASDPRGTALLAELSAAANHRTALQADLAELARDVRRMQIDALATILDDCGIDADLFPPALVAAGIQGLALVVVEDGSRGYDTGHDEARAAMERLVGCLEERRHVGHAARTTAKRVDAPPSKD
jgi:AcrR family transcriptional regulator